MSKRSKLERFEDVRLNPYVLEMGKPLFEEIKGKWHETYFKNKKPIVLELGCGRGEYTVGLAEKFPDYNFIGIDIKGNRLWVGAEQAKAAQMPNVAFLRTQILLLEKFFEKGEVEEIWVTFPDPRLKDSDEKRRLISPRFLDIYRKVIKPEGLVHLKTDCKPLYDYALDLVLGQDLGVLSATDDLYNSEWVSDHFGLKTTYEKKYLEQGIKINYLRFKLK